MKTFIKVFSAALVVTACSGDSEPDTKRPTARDTAAPAHDMSAMTDSSADTTAMAGMDHSQMPGMQSSANSAGMQGGQTGGSMAGMDHSQMGKTAAGRQQPMAGMDHSQMRNMPARGRQSMAGMDHSQMQNNAARGQQPMAGMDHSQMQNAPGTRQQPMAGMDHSRMNMQPNTGAATQMQHQMPIPQAQAGRTNPPGGMQMAPPADPPEPEDAALEKIRAVVAELVRDPRIQARIQSDTALRRLWQDPGVQQYLMKRP